MNERLFQQKKNLLRRISSKTYYSLINYIGRIYNGEYDLVISMARKFSNLYLALLPLVKTEYFGSIDKEHKQKEQNQGIKTPIIISNRALDWILVDIKANKEKTRFKKILLADDIIIHGSTIKNIEEKLKHAYAEAGISEDNYLISITAYAENMDGLVLDPKAVDQKYMEKCTRSSWKDISGQIVDILYIMGQPYTSYVPNARIKMESKAGKKITDLISQGKIKKFENKEAEKNNSRVYVSVLDSDDSFKICETYRIYAFDLLEEYVFVPMVSINPINENMLAEYISLLKVCLRENEKDYLQTILDSCRNEYRYFLVIYILSAISGWKFWQNNLELDPIDCKYNEVEEEFNFSCPFLRQKNDLEKETSIAKIFAGISEIYDKHYEEIQGVSLEKLDTDAKLLTEKISSLVCSRKKYSSSNISIANLSRMIGKFLEMNGNLDEAGFQKEKADQTMISHKRMTGIPIVSLVKIMHDLTNDIESIFIAILEAVDFGKGSIVPHPFKSGSQIIYAAVLHAGEQNYRYYVDNYLALMYGMYLLELYQKDNLVQSSKEVLWQEYSRNMNEEEAFFYEYDKQYLIETSIKKEFEDVIVNEAFVNRSNPKIKEISAKVKELIDGE